MDSLYDDSDLYNLVAPADPAMERFYIEAAGGPGREVLELACGTGRITAPLAASGARVIGGDLSATMLAHARTALARSGLDVELLQIDMRDFELRDGRRLDAVVIAANSLLHLQTASDFERAFTSIRRHLVPGGRFCFDIFVPSTVLLARNPDQRDLLGRFAHPVLGEVTIMETIAYDPVTQVSQVTWYWSTLERGEFRQSSLEMRQIFPQELPLLLGSGGFELIERFGDFDRSPLTRASRRQVCIAVAA
jgi:SAM-dependent methyltransferase